MYSFCLLAFHFCLLASESINLKANELNHKLRRKRNNNTMKCASYVSLSIWNFFYLHFVALRIFIFFAIYLQVNCFFILFLWFLNPFKWKLRKPISSRTKLTFNSSKSYLKKMKWWFHLSTLNFKNKGKKDNLKLEICFD